MKELAALPRAIVPRLNRFASGWQLIDDTHVQITVTVIAKVRGMGVAVITNTCGGRVFLSHNAARWLHAETVLLRQITQSPKL